ncbi:hypothetical protein ACFPES_28875 [Paenibacillus sp. GCM10023248]|uniref:hypothetical protein n=1 Tax=unclassified Paenibacillus TaxID=185978 RepID=UPI002378FC58|nr:hypothetical protein [Paenibacillus sp. MAHUQ-63]MDD9271067.1 hypothetical protein [Paenibacillus sp. MAHUQ-63]
MKTISRKILTGSLIASFVLGVGFVGALHNQAFAATDTAASSTTAAPAQKAGFGKGGKDFGDRGGFRGGSVLKETATILGVEESAVQEALKAGKTLAAFAEEQGIAKADYLAKLVAAETTAINDQVTAGKLTQEQADKILTGLSDQLTKQIDGTKGGFPGGDRGGKGKGYGGGNLVQEAATVLGVEPSAVQEALQAGQTLSAFAVEKGLTEADFVAKLVAAETAAIHADVTAGKLTQEQADSRLQDLSDRITKQVQNTRPVGGEGRGFGGHGGPGGFFGNPDAVTTILGITQDELRTELEAGKSIADVAAAKGISEDDLISKIKESMTDSIKQHVEQKGAPKGPRGAAQPAPTAQTPAAAN